MGTQKITIPENGKVSIENGVIIIESNEPKFKRGDILESIGSISDVLIFDEFEKGGTFKSLAVKLYDNDDIEWQWGWFSRYFRHASDQSKQLLFDHLKSQGKRWNAEKMVVEEISEKLKVGDLVICWDGNDYESAGIYDYRGMTTDSRNYCTNRVFWEHAVKFESIEQFKKILKGEM